MDKALISIFNLTVGLNKISIFEMKIGLITQYLFILVLYPLSAYTCPEIRGLPDLNCNENITVLTIGDSITYGYGDVSAQNGGYPVRLQNYLDPENTEVQVIKFAKGGTTCSVLFSRIRNELRRGLVTKIRPDVGIVNCGWNDFYRKQKPQATVSRIRRIGRLLLKNEIFPLLTTMTPNLRGNQETYAKRVNNMLGKKQVLPFNRLNSKVDLSRDGLHPNSNGHAHLMHIALNGLFSVYKKNAVKN